MGLEFVIHIVQNHILEQDFEPVDLYTRCQYEPEVVLVAAEGSIAHFAGC